MPSGSSPRATVPVLCRSATAQRTGCCAHRPVRSARLRPRLGLGLCPCVRACVRRPLCAVARRAHTPIQRTAAYDTTLRRCDDAPRPRDRSIDRANREPCSSKPRPVVCCMCVARGVLRIIRCTLRAARHTLHVARCALHIVWRIRTIASRSRPRPKAQPASAGRCASSTICPQRTRKQPSLTATVRRGVPAHSAAAVPPSAVRRRLQPTPRQCMRLPVPGQYPAGYGQYHGAETACLALDHATAEHFEPLAL